MKMSRWTGWCVLAVPVALTVVGLAFAQPPQPGKAFVRVLLPPGADTATVSFGMQVTKEQTGRDRLFETPVLEPGKKYFYEVSAAWKTPDGKEMNRKQKVYVNPGATALVDFNKPDKGEMKTSTETRIPRTETDTRSTETKSTETKTEDTKTEDTKKPDTKKRDTNTETKTEKTEKLQARASASLDLRLAAASEGCWIGMEVAILRRM
jgi:uncharacterized protein (TIGR03000 family)